MIAALPADFGSSTPKQKLTLPEGFTGLVLHCCCAPCSGAVLECLLCHQIRPLVLFYNPNIFPEPEYLRRREELVSFAAALGLECVTDEYAEESWLKAVSGLEHEPERGRRCRLCFEYRLRAAAGLAQERGMSHFTSTLATSRWKSKAQLDEAGRSVAAASGVGYWDEDWRRGGLSVRRSELVRKLEFYNQDYCGCRFSLAVRQASLRRRKDCGTLPSAADVPSAQMSF